MTRLTESRALREPKPATGQTFLRCSEIKGFCVGILPSGRRTYCVETTVKGKKQRQVIGLVGIMAFETGDPNEPGALDIAKAAIGGGRLGRAIAETIEKKKAPSGITLNEVWAKYVEAGFPKLGRKAGGNKRPSTIKSDTDRWNKHVAPTLGKEPVAAIDTPRMQRFIDKIPTRGQRAHTLILVKSIIAYAKSRGLATTNEIDMVAEKSREQQDFYDDEERILLDQAAAEIAAESPHRLHVFTAIRIILRTGARSGEIFSARWDKLNERRLILRIVQDKTSDTGRDIHLSAGDLALIKALPRFSVWIFPGESESGHLTTVQKSWTEVTDRAGLPRYRPHDMRHSYISSALNNGQSLYVTGKLAGHKNPSTTQRYAHLEDKAFKTAHAATDLDALATAPKLLAAE